jgi:hypothetical protein
VQDVKPNCGNMKNWGMVKYYGAIKSGFTKFTILKRKKIKLNARVGMSLVLIKAGILK